MITGIPTSAELRTRLAKLSHAEVRQLADGSGVPFSTLWKIRKGSTRNPGIETVRKFMPHVAKLSSTSTAMAVAVGSSGEESMTPPEDGFRQKCSCPQSLALRVPCQ